MARRLFLVGLIAFAFACKSNKAKNTNGSMAGDGGQRTVEPTERDDIEKGLLSLGIDGRVLRIDLNEGRAEADRIRIVKAHILSDLLLLETDGAHPKLFALERNGLQCNQNAGCTCRRRRKRMTVGFRVDCSKPQSRRALTAVPPRGVRVNAALPGRIHRRERRGRQSSVSHAPNSQHHLPAIPCRKPLRQCRMSELYPRTQRHTQR